MAVLPAQRVATPLDQHISRDPVPAAHLPFPGDHAEFNRRLLRDAEAGLQRVLDAGVVNQGSMRASSREIVTSSAGLVLVMTGAGTLGLYAALFLAETIGTTIGVVEAATVGYFRGLLGDNYLQNAINFGGGQAVTMLVGISMAGCIEKPSVNNAIVAVAAGVFQVWYLSGSSNSYTSWGANAVAAAIGVGAIRWSLKRPDIL